MATLASKFGDFTFNQLASFADQTAGSEEVVKAVLSGTMVGSVQEGRLVVAERESTFFDCHSRFIPPRGLQLSVKDANYSFHLDRPAKVDYPERLQRLMDYQRLKDSVSPSEFEDRAGKILERLLADERLANIVKGDRACPLPFCLPQQQISYKQYGQVLEGFVEAASRAYRVQFPKRNFNNYRKGELAGQTYVIGGLRHEYFLAALAKGNVVGVYFPNPLQGYSPFAQRAMMAFMPAMFCLAGGIDTLTAVTAWPDVLARDFNTPGLDMSALQWRSAGFSLLFGADDDEARFGDRGGLGDALDSYSGGLVVLG